MYEQFFGFRQRPFSSAPHPRNYIPLENTESTREKLLRAVVRAEGPALLVGPPGTGKSILLRVLAEQLRPKFEVVLLSHSRFPSVRALLQSILCELGQPFRGLDEGELRLSLIQYVTTGEASSPLVLLVDEADTLPFRLLEEIRTLLNIMHRDEPAVRVVLAGGTALEERLTAPKLQMLSQRISARCYLDALTRSETFFYIREQVSRAGQKPEQIFPEPSCQAIYHATGGVPRLINQVCDHALILAFADGLKTVSPEIVQQAWSDLQQFPLPWDPPKPSSSAQSVIEFGTWTDMDDQLSSGEQDCTTQQMEGNPSSVARSIPGNVDLEETQAKDWSLLGPHGEVSPSVSERDSAEIADSARAVIESLAAQVTSEANTRPDAAPLAPEGLSERPDPVARLEDLTQAVAELHRDLSSQTEKKPEAELVFYDWGDPFEETFANEVRVQPRASVPPQEATRQAAAAPLVPSHAATEVTWETIPVEDQASSPHSEAESKTVPPIREPERDPQAETVLAEISLTDAGSLSEKAPGMASRSNSCGETPNTPTNGVQQQSPVGIASTLDFSNAEKAEQEAHQPGHLRQHSPKFRTLFSRLRKDT